MIQHGRHHPARTAGGRRDNAAARGILFAHRQGIGKDQPPALQAILIPFGLDIIRRSLAPQVQRPRQHALLVEPPLDGLAHHGPHLGQVVPEVVVLALLYILPIAAPRAFAPVEDLGHVVHLIKLGRLVESLPPLGQSTSADAEDRPFVGHLALAVLRTEGHAVGVKGQKHRGLPHNLDRCMGAQRVEDSHIGQVPPARRSQAAVECHLESRRIAVTFQKHFRSLARPHRMAARRAIPYAIYLSYGFHLLYNIM